MGLANQGETVLAWDPATGRPLTDAVVWQDRRAEGICAELAAHGDELKRLTGLPLDPYFAAPKMAWLRRERTREGVVTTSDSWLVHQLTGAFVTDAATAGRTQLLGLHDVGWSPAALEIFGLADERLPTVVDCAGPVGTTTAFGGEVPLTGLLVDQQAALLAQNALEPGQAKCTYGTGAFLLAQTGGSTSSGSSGLVSCVAWRLGGRTAYCLDGQVYTAASAVRWLTDLGVISGAGDLDPVGASVPDTGGVTFVPALSRPRRALVAQRPARLGDRPRPRHHRGPPGPRPVRGHRRAGRRPRRRRRLRPRGPLTTLRVDGGLTRSALLMQTQADLLQRPVEVSALPDVTALGAGVVARLGLDPDLQPGLATPEWRPSAVYEPRIGPEEAAERLAGFRTAVDSLLERA